MTNPKATRQRRLKHRRTRRHAGAVYALEADDILRSNAAHLGLSPYASDRAARLARRPNAPI